MIWESWHWKQPLLKMADRLAQFKASNELSDEELAQVERDIFIGFYSVRKLLEAPAKITVAAGTTTASKQLIPLTLPCTTP